MQKGEGVIVSGDILDWTQAQINIFGRTHKTIKKIKK